MKLIHSSSVLALLGLVILAGCSSSSSSDPPPAVVPQTLESPVRLSVSPTGDVWTVDHQENRVLRMSGVDLEISDSFSVGARPSGVVFFAGILFVAEQTRGSVSVFDQSGTLLYQLGQGDGEFLQPNGLALNEVDSLLYVVDLKAAGVRVFNLDGVDSGVTIGSTELRAPTAVAFDPVRKEVLVSDFGVPDLPQVRVYAQDGTFLRSLTGVAGGGSSSFSAPQGLVVDGEGHVFLVDSLRGEVLVLDQLTGVLLTTIGTRGTGAGELYLPLDVAIDPGTGDLFVANNQLARIEVYRNGGVLP